MTWYSDESFNEAIVRLNTQMRLALLGAPSPLGKKSGCPCGADPDCTGWLCKRCFPVLPPHSQAYLTTITPGKIDRARAEEVRIEMVTAEVLAAVSEPLGLTGGSLPAYGVPGDGCCRECLRPPVHASGLCVYCGEVEARTVPDRMAYWRPLLFVIAAAMVMYGTIALFWALGAIQ